ncbi:stage II sporulation protein M [Pseudonocardia endophytica]|uniref:Stage II sporulation protein M n=1 Tax=Pseudonocardia endophytica TaxID=401976 RepID=A0A4R1HYT0_PSEEN|nr:stage II sporulation protein M [Pseudonocardia endophytica]TCK27568.1 hypothetical protein EV378_3440 [Pseudonocardia endophytica]
MTQPTTRFSPAQFVRAPLRLVRTHLRAHLALSGLMYGALLLGMAAAIAFPSLNADRVAGMDGDGTTDLVVSLLRNPWLFALTILAVNVLTVALPTILLPSLVVPFSGVAVGVYHAVGFGLTLAPVNGTAAAVLIPHSLTILIEIQAYVLVMLGAYLLGRAWLRPAAVGAPDRRRGYLLGLRQVGLLALPAMVLFVVGAVYEALSLRYIVPVLAGG